MKDPVRIYFGLLKILVKYKMKLKLGTRLSTYHFPSLYTILAHNLNKDIRIDLIEINFLRECSCLHACAQCLHVTTGTRFSLRNSQKVMHGLVLYLSLLYCLVCSLQDINQLTSWLSCV